MEFLTGLTPEETLELEELLDASRIGTEVRVRGAVHTIRDMGELSFVVLRKRDGLLQCIFEEGTTNYAVKDLREEMAVEISGVLEEDARAPHGIEIRAREVKVFGRPYEAPPLPIGKWKLNTSLEAKLNYRSAAHPPAPATPPARPPTLPVQPAFHRDPHSEDRQQGCRGRLQRLQARLFPSSGRARTESAVLQTDDGRCV